MSQSEQDPAMNGPMTQNEAMEARFNQLEQQLAETQAKLADTEAKLAETKAEFEAFNNTVNVKFAAVQTAGSLEEAQAFAKIDTGANAADDNNANRDGTTEVMNKRRNWFGRNKNNNDTTPPADDSGNKKERKLFRRRNVAAALVGVLALGGIGYAVASGNDEKPKTPAAQTATTEKPAPSLVNGDSSERVAAQKLADEALPVNGPLEAAEKLAQDPAQVKAALAAEAAAADTKKTPAWESAPTVNSATEKMQNGDDARSKEQVHEIFDADRKENSNYKGKMTHLGSFTAESLEKADGIQAIALASVADTTYLRAEYNGLNGRPADAPTNATREQMLAAVEKGLTHKDTKFENIRAEGPLKNYGIVNGVLISSELNAAGADGIRAVRVAYYNGNNVDHKVGGGTDASGAPCMNIIERKNSRVVTYQSTYKHVPANTVNTPPAPETTKDKPTTTKDVDDGPKTKEKGDDVKTSDTDETPEPKKETDKKHDDAKLPGSGVETDNDKGTPEPLEPTEPTTGTSPGTVPRQPQDPAPEVKPPNSVVGNKPPAGTGQGPATTDPNGSATAPGTNGTTSPDKIGNPDTNSI